MAYQLTYTAVKHQPRQVIRPASRARILVGSINLIDVVVGG
jgi:hypothetical protein